MFDLMKIGEVVVNVDGNGRYCLNDLHKASGGAPRHRPQLWLEGAQVQELIQELCNESAYLPDAGIPASTAGGPLRVVKGGAIAYQGTFACKELVYAYAMWISPSFNLRVIRAFDNIQQVKQQTQGAVDLEDPEFLQGLLMKYAEDKKRLTQEKAQLESKVVVQDTVIAVQEEQISALNNLFKEGMKLVDYARQLNGVNIVALKRYVGEDLGWLYFRNSKGCSSTSSARGKYLRDTSYQPDAESKAWLWNHDVELLQEGAVKLYSLYLEGKLPMVKTWNGKFTHEVM